MSELIHWMLSTISDGTTSPNDLIYIEESIGIDSSIFLIILDKIMYLESDKLEDIVGLYTTTSSYSVDNR